MRRRRASILLLTALFLAIPASALASIDPIEPSSGTVEQGKSTTARVTVTSSEETCLQASTSDLTISVQFSDPCDSGRRSVTMTVSTDATLTPTGKHTVTIKEVVKILDPLLGVVISVETVDSLIWNLTVTAPGTTSSTSSSTTSTTSSTTSSTTTTSTTTTSTTTTSTTQPGRSSTTSTSGGLTNSATGSVTGGGATNTTLGAGGSGGSRGSETSRGTPRPTSTTVSIPEVALPELQPGEAGTEFSAAPVSGPLSRVLSPRLPPPLVDAVLSPLIVLEVVTSAMGQSASALLVPLAALLAYALWLFRDTIVRLLRFNRRGLAADTSRDHPPSRAS